MKLPNVNQLAIHFNVFLLVFFSLLLYGCGGGSAGTPAPSLAPTKYTIGGTVSGINGTVVLQNNSGDNLTVNAVGSFTFATKMTLGSSYKVTILTQPTNQTCTVSYGSGMVNGVNITDVIVACSNKSFTVGGTVSGLGGTPLSGTIMLQLNGFNMVGLYADGGFTFPTKVADGSPYMVTILSTTQPTNQTCTVSNGSGVVSGSDVNSVTVVCSASTDAYSVGGTISGLSGSAWLSNNNNDSLMVNKGSGTFTFNNKVAYNSPYKVMVGYPPIGQSCSVANGSGIMGKVNVTNVTITCAANNFTIGGTVTGLDGSMVLQNNGSDNLTLAANGSFSFPITVAKGNAYSVSVLSQPSSLQTCSLSNGNGTATADVNNVTVSCAFIAGPSSITTSVVSSKQINLSWTFTPPVNDITSGYAIFRKDGSTGFYKIAGSVPFSSTTFNDLDLSPNTTYFYKIYYYYLTNTSNGNYTNLRTDYSAEVSATTSNDAVIPVAPSALSANTPGGFAVNLTWTDNSNNEDGFYIERSLDNITFTQIDSVQPNTTFYQDRQVVASKPYYYRVRSYNSLGNSAYTSVATATTPTVSSTAIGGTIYGADTTLTLASSPYYVSTSIVLLNGYTLTVEPGVEIRFAAGTGMEIRGALKAIGTASAPIFFTSYSPDTATNTSWNGIHIANNLGGSGTIAFSNISFASSGISYDWMGGSTYIYDSTFSINTNAEYGSGAVLNLRTLYTQNTTGIFGGSGTVYYNKFEKNGTGLGASQADIKYCIFNSNSNLGVGLGFGNFQYNIVTGSPIGFQVLDLLTFSYNLLTNNTVGYSGQGYPGNSLINNNIFGNTTYNYAGGNAYDVTMTNNWWGSTDATVINATIYDVYNNPSLGVATFQPFLLTPVDLLP